MLMQKSYSQANDNSIKPVTARTDLSYTAMNKNEHQQNSLHIIVPDQSVEPHIGINMLSENQQTTRQISQTSVPYPVRAEALPKPVTSEQFAIRN